MILLWLLGLFHLIIYYVLLYVMIGTIRIIIVDGQNTKRQINVFPDIARHQKISGIASRRIYQRRHGIKQKKRKSAINSSSRKKS